MPTRQPRRGCRPHEALLHPGDCYEATANDGTISAFGAQSAQGTLWDVMRGFLDVGPWTELFIEDRPTRWPTRAGQAAWCWSIATTLQGPGPGEGLHLAAEGSPETLEIGDDAVMSLEIGRSTRTWRTTSR